MKQKSKILPLSREIIKNLNIEPGEKFKIAVGKKVLTARIVEELVDINDKPQAVYVTEELSNILGLPGDIYINVIRDDRMLRMGPLIGVLAGRYNKEKRSFGAQNGFFFSLMAVLRDLNGAGYVFCPQDIDRERKCIHAYYLSSNPSDKRWKRMWFPFPDVCYNRYFDYGTSISGSYHTTALLARYGTKVFNTSIGSKWSVHRLLVQQTDIAPHLPDTRLLDSSQTLISMLKAHKEVYLKLTYGSKGNGIIRISRKKGAYIVKTSDDSYCFICRSPREIQLKIRANMESSTPIIQQSIRCSKDNRHTDFRVLVQKNRCHEWMITGAAARIGASGRITTNLHTGGKAEKLDTILKDRGFDRLHIKSIAVQMEDLALRIAQILDSKTRVLGELGLDFLVDNDGKVWFLEANPKPGRRSFSDISQEMRQMSISRPMEYACRLAGF